MAYRSRVEVAERMTAEQFWRDAPEARNAELIDGVFLMPSPPTVIHERLFRFLFQLLATYTEVHTLGEVFGSRTAVELAEDQVVEPDILFIASDGRAIIRDKGIVGAPDLVIEILSVGTARNDRGPKFRAYERAGVRELWLVDPYGPAGTEFYRRSHNRFVPVMPAADGTLTSITLPGFWIDVNWLWPEEHFMPVAARWPQLPRVPRNIWTLTSPWRATQ
jgi:Uma2 family endonuclease